MRVCARQAAAVKTSCRRQSLSHLLTLPLPSRQKTCPPPGSSNVDRLEMPKRKQLIPMTQINPHMGNERFQRESLSRKRHLEKKCAVVFGAGGSIGATVAKEFAAEGAQVFLAGRTKSNLEFIAGQIVASGGTAQIAVIDALD